MPKPGDKEVGGHAVMAVGYDNTTGMVKVRNSWGNKLGPKRLLFHALDYITDFRLADDFWTAEAYSASKTNFGSQYPLGENQEGIFLDFFLGITFFIGVKHHRSRHLQTVSAAS